MNYVGPWLLDRESHVTPKQREEAILNWAPWCQQRNPRLLKDSPGSGGMQAVWAHVTGWGHHIHSWGAPQRARLLCFVFLKLQQGLHHVFFFKLHVGASSNLSKQNLPGTELLQGISRDLGNVITQPQVLFLDTLSRVLTCRWCWISIPLAKQHKQKKDWNTEVPSGWPGKQRQKGEMVLITWFTTEGGQLKLRKNQTLAHLG